MRRRLIGQGVGLDAAAKELGQDFASVAKQADRDRFLLRAGALDDREGFVEIGRVGIEIASAQAEIDAARPALDGEARGARHHRRQRLRPAHAAQAGGEQPAALQVAAIMLAAHLGEGLVGALHDALGADIDPGAGGHLAIHGQALPIELAEMLPGRPTRHQIRIGDQHARRVLVGSEDADGLARLNQQGLIVFQRLQRSDDAIKAFPVARGTADAAINHELAGPFRDLGIEIVHQHAHRRFGQPALGGDLRAAGSANIPAIVDTGHSAAPQIVGMRLPPRAAMAPERTSALAFSMSGARCRS